MARTGRTVVRDGRKGDTAEQQRGDAPAVPVVVTMNVYKATGDTAGLWGEVVEVLDRKCHIVYEDGSLEVVSNAVAVDLWRAVKPNKRLQSIESLSRLLHHVNEYEAIPVATTNVYKVTGGTAGLWGEVVEVLDRNYHIVYEDGSLEIASEAVAVDLWRAVKPRKHLRSIESLSRLLDRVREYESAPARAKRGHATVPQPAAAAHPPPATRKANSNGNEKCSKKQRCGRTEAVVEPNPYPYVVGSNAQTVPRGYAPPDHHLGRDRPTLDKVKQKFFDVRDGFDASDPMSVDTLVQFLEGVFDGVSVEDSNKALNRFLGYLIDPKTYKPELIERSHQHIVISIGYCLPPETAGLTEQDFELTAPSDFDKAQECIVNALEDNVAFWFMNVRPHRCIHYPTLPGRWCSHCCDLAEHECINRFLALSAIARYCKKLGYCGIAVVNSGGKKTDRFFKVFQQVEATFRASGASGRSFVYDVCGISEIEMFTADNFLNRCSLGRFLKVLSGEYVNSYGWQVSRFSQNRRPVLTRILALFPLTIAIINPSQATRERRRYKIASYLREKELLLFPFLKTGLFDSFRDWLCDNSSQEWSRRGKCHHNNIFFQATVREMSSTANREALIPYGATYLEFCRSLRPWVPNSRHDFKGFTDANDPIGAEMLTSTDFPLERLFQNILL
jgi:ribosomal protein L24